MQDEDPTRRERIKKHLKENKKSYFAAAGASAVTATTLLIFQKKPDISLMVGSRNIQLLNWKPVNTNIVITALGDPGDVVERVSDGKRWASKGELARDLGIHRTVVSRYFNNTLPDLLDEQYKVIGKAGHEIPE